MCRAIENDVSYITNQGHAAIGHVGDEDHVIGP
jgi:hypothetical protein